VRALGHFGQRGSLYALLVNERPRAFHKPVALAALNRF
jgi:hypothetical protein